VEAPVKPILIHQSSEEINDTLDNPSAKVIEQRLDPKAVSLNLRNFPVVVLYGPPKVGKSSILGSLNFHVKKRASSYKLEFRVDTGVVQNAPDGYETRTNQFLDQASSGHEVGGSVDFALVSALKNQKLQFYFLEAPGEHFFDPDQPQREALHYRYLVDLFSSENKKIVCYIFTPNMFSSKEILLAYKSNIEASMRSLSKNDEVIVIATKINEKNDVEIDSDIVKSWFDPGQIYGDFGRMFQTSKFKNVRIIPYASHKMLNNHTKDGKAGVAQFDGKYQKSLMQLLIQKTKEPNWFLKLFNRN
jgi:hypothetical protein